MTQDRPTTPCIEHAGALTSRGYGATWYENKYCLAHRRAYCEHNGVSLVDIAGKVVRHRCDNKPCINGEHLLLGTAADNSQDQVDRGMQGVKPHLTMEQARAIRRDYIPGTRWNPSPTGQRQLARLYGVPQSVIQQIVNNITYKE